VPAPQVPQAPPSGATPRATGGGPAAPPLAASGTR
jgi:hypothetical protein